MNRNGFRFSPVTISKTVPSTTTRDDRSEWRRGRHVEADHRDSYNVWTGRPTNSAHVPLNNRSVIPENPQNPPRPSRGKRARARDKPTGVRTSIRPSVWQFGGSQHPFTLGRAHWRAAMPRRTMASTRDHHWTRPSVVPV